MIEDLVDVLDRSWSGLDELKSIDFARACFPFMAQLKRDARTALHLEDMRRENQQSLDELTRVVETACCDLLAIVEDLVKVQPNVLSNMRVNPGSPEWTLPGIRRRLQGDGAPEVPDTWLLAQEQADAQRITVVRSMQLEVEALIKSAGVPELLVRIDIAQQELDRAVRERRIYFNTGAGASLGRIEHVMATLHPQVLAPGSRGRLAQLVNLKNLNVTDPALYEHLFEEPWPRSSGKQPRRVDDAALRFLRADVRRIYQELRRQIGSERSLLALIQRYRQKCEWYDSERLRVLAMSEGGTREDRLTETLATFLFDHGLNPLTRPLVGRTQPDLLGAELGFSFYIEAKQYSSGHPGYLLNGMQQIWDMLDNLHGTKLAVREAFYVIYRLGGPRYAFPPRIQHRDRVVHIIVVDIAEMSARGVHAPHTQSFREEQLLPGSALAGG